jgi:membrane dipeptidase
MTDMARLRQGRVGGQFWSVYISGTIVGDEAIRTTIEQIDTARRLIEAYPRDLELAFTANDMVRIHRSGRIGSMLGMEGGRQIGGSIAALRRFYDLGVRYMTLTHNQTTDWADSATDEPKHDGISAAGAIYLAEMNRLGMLIDLSHVSPAAMRDALEMTRAPVIFSHSNAAALNPHPRNVPDDVLRLLPANGGVVMVNFYPVFLSPDVRQWALRRTAEEARLKSLFSFSADQAAAGLKAWEAANPRPPVSVGLVADHIEHIARTAGYDHVGIGGDLDGVPFTAEGLESVAGYPLLFAELIRRGWSDANLAKLAGGNVLRALRRAEAVSGEMRSVPRAHSVPLAK